MASEDWVNVPADESLVVALEGDKQAGHGAIERSNLLNMAKLTVKSLIESSMRFGRTLADDHPPLQQLLIAVELVLRHKLKAKRNLLGQRKSFFGVIEQFEKISGDFAESVASVRSIPGIRSMAGRGRAWLRFVLMQKKLSDLFRVMVERREILMDWYEPGAILLCDEGAVVSGLLVGLNAVDYNVMMRPEAYDQSVGVLDMSQYLKDGNYLGKPDLEDDLSEEDQQTELGKLLDQKAYLEELNRKFEAQVERLQSKLQSFESMNEALSATVMSLEAQLREMGHERDELRSMNESSSAQLRRALENIHDDQRTELETHIQAKSGLNELYASSQKTLDAEMKLREQLEQELELQRSIREEKETALQLLEKSTHEKQDTIVTLRKQLEEMKSANIKMQAQLKTSKETHQKDSLKIRNSESQLSQLTVQCKKSEKEFDDVSATLKDAEQTARELGSKLEEVQLARSTAESDLAIERQWRMSLQAELQKEKNRVVELTNETKQFKAMKKGHAELQEKYACLQETVSEQEIGLVEMGKQLSLSQQRVSDMKEVHSQVQEGVWTDDSEVAECKQCSKTFSVARRKHHCRSCGGIFCFACSDNAMQLASSSKPVRVCDACYSMLLSRAST